jgi:hypothetical protein
VIRTTAIFASLLTTALAAAAIAADAPKALSGAAPGQWELTGVEGSKTAVRECLTDLAILGRFEHRARSCTAKTLSDNGKVTVINYSCGAGNFGRTSIKVVTPRNIRAETQGISDGLPFSYTIDARRIGECKSAGAPSERGH